jgi:hypothetical protein
MKVNLKIKKQTRRHSLHNREFLEEKGALHSREFLEEKGALHSRKKKELYRTIMGFTIQ